jgi:tripartite-type tricarboxylate transporter receptor subunit TctC
LVVITWYGLLAPAGLRPAIIERLNTEVAKVMNTPETKNKLAQIGQDVATSTPAEFGKFVRAEYQKWGRVIKGLHCKTGRRSRDRVCAGPVTRRNGLEETCRSNPH